MCVCQCVWGSGARGNDLPDSVPEVGVKSFKSLVTPSAAAKSETVLLGRAQAETLLSCRVGEQEL